MSFAHSSARWLSGSKNPVFRKKPRFFAPRLLPCWALLLLFALPQAELRAERRLMLVVGAEGTAQYREQFARWVDQWSHAAKEAEATVRVIGSHPGIAPWEQLKQALADEPKGGPEEFWLVMIGHGTYDGRTARFNLRGADVSATELAGWLKPFSRPLVIINCSSSSGPFINRLSAPGRTVITATRSGNEENFCRFGGYLADAVANLDADYDKDKQVSLLEAFLAAARRVDEFYRSEARLATEHALMDDNGDGLGTPALWFRGIRATKKAKDSTNHDGIHAHQIVLIRSEDERHIPPELRAKRNRMELAVAELRERKETMDQEDYYQQLERILIKLAKLNEQIERQTKPNRSEPAG